MPAEDGVIDLDKHDGVPAGAASVSPSRRAAGHPTTLRLAAAFVVGVVLGGVGVNELRDSREHREQRISLVAIPATTSGTGANSPGRVRLDGQLALINAGPAPITILAATGQRPDARLRYTGQPRPIPPGSTALVDVEVRFDCSIPIEQEPLPVRFSIKTNDNQDREVNAPVTLLFSVWYRDLLQACDGLG